MRDVAERPIDFVRCTDDANSAHEFADDATAPIHVDARADVDASALAYADARAGTHAHIKPRTAGASGTGFHAALNAGDVESAMTYIADEAVMARGPYGTGHGKGELRAIFEQEIRDGTKFKLSNCQIKGNRVACDYRVTVGGSIVDSGKVPEGWTGETGTEVRDGKIFSDL